MSKEQRVIVIPGLRDHLKPITLATNHWRHHGLEPVVYSMEWTDERVKFPSKLAELGDLIKEFAIKGDEVSLVGCSAGGSMAINAFFESENRVHKVINVCGRLRTGFSKGFRSLDRRSKSSPAFKQSVELCERRIEELSTSDLKKIMTMRAMLGDELVPAETSILEGAYNTTIPTVEHILSIGAALTVFSKPLIAFLKGSN